MYTKREHGLKPNVTKMLLLFLAWAALQMAPHIIKHNFVQEVDA